MAPDPRDDYEQQIAELNSGIASKKDIFRNDYEEAKAPNRMTQQDAFIQGVMQLGPGILGYAMAGEEGALAGLEGGSAGGDQYMQAVQQRLAQEQAQELGVLSLDQQGIQDDERRRDRLQGTVDQYDFKEFSGEQSAKVAEAKRAAKLVDDAKGEIPDDVYLRLLESIDKGESPSPEDQKILMQTKAGKTALKEARTDVFKNKQEDRRFAALENTQKRTGMAEDEAGRKAEDQTYEQFPGSKRVRSTNVAKFDKSLTDYMKVTRALTKLEGLFKGGENNLTGEGAAKVQTTMATLMLHLKEQANLGAAFTDAEIEIIENQMPNAKATTGAWKQFMDEFLNRGQLVKIKSMLEVSDVNMQDELVRAGAYTFKDVGAGFEQFKQDAFGGAFENEAELSGAPIAMPKIDDFNGDYDAYEKALDDIIAGGNQ